MINTDLLLKYYIDVIASRFNRILAKSDSVNVTQCKNSFLFQRYIIMWVMQCKCLCCIANVVYQ